MEPKLWRPLGMDSEAYDNKIESAKKNGPAHSIEQGDNIISKVAETSSKSTNHFQQGNSSTQKEFSVCCAQQQQSQSYICKTPRPLTAITPDGGISVESGANMLLTEEQEQQFLLRE